jgi:hypothetical protein
MGAYLSYTVFHFLTAGEADSLLWQTERKKLPIGFLFCQLAGPDALWVTTLEKAAFRRALI